MAVRVNLHALELDRNNLVATRLRECDLERDIRGQTHVVTPRIHIRVIRAVLGETHPSR